MDCPECGSPLSPEQHDGIELDACDRCHGLWFDRGELAEYWRASRSAGESPPVDAARLDPDPGSTTLTCPRCASPTLARRRADVFHAGICASCHGVWLGQAERPARKVAGVKDRNGGGWFQTALELAVDLWFEAVRRR